MNSSASSVELHDDHSINMSSGWFIAFYVFVCVITMVVIYKLCSACHRSKRNINTISADYVIPMTDMSGQGGGRVTEYTTRVMYMDEDGHGTTIGHSSTVGQTDRTRMSSPPPSYDEVVRN